MKQRTQAGVGVHCRQSQVITEYMENTLPTDVDRQYRQVYDFDFICVRGLRLLHFWRSFNLLEVMWLRIKCYFSSCKCVRSPTMSGIARDGILYFFI